MTFTLDRKTPIIHGFAKEPDGCKPEAEATTSSSEAKIREEAENVPTITTTAEPSTTADTNRETPRPLQQNLIPEKPDLRSLVYKKRAATALNKLLDFSHYCSGQEPESVAMGASEDEYTKLMSLALGINAWIGQLIEYLKEQDANDRQAVLEVLTK
jgi:hypothetical protein